MAQSLYYADVQSILDTNCRALVGSQSYLLFVFGWSGDGLSESFFILLENTCILGKILELFESTFREFYFEVNILDEQVTRQCKQPTVEDIRIYTEDEICDICSTSTSCPMPSKDGVGLLAVTAGKDGVSLAEIF